MKRILASGLMVFFVFGALLSPVWAKKSEDAAIHKQIQSLLDSVAAMFDKKDLEGLVRTVVPGATLRYANGKEQTIEEWKSQVSKEFAGIATMKSKFKVERVVSAGDTSVATLQGGPQLRSNSRKRPQVSQCQPLECYLGENASRVEGNSFRRVFRKSNPRRQAC